MSSESLNVISLLYIYIFYYNGVISVIILEYRSVSTRDYSEN